MMMMMMMIQKRGSTESVLTDFAQLRSRQPVAKGKEREREMRAVDNMYTYIHVLLLYTIK